MSDTDVENLRVHQGVEGADHAHCWHERTDAPSFCCGCEGLQDVAHAAQPPAKTLEQLAEEIAAEIHFETATRFRRFDLKAALIAFAEEIKRSSIEP